MKTETVKLSQVQVNEANPRTITNEKFQKLVNSVLALPKMLELRPIVVDNMMVALGGNMRFRALTAISDLSEDELKSRLFSINDVKKKTEGEQQALLTHWLRWRDARPQSSSRLRSCQTQSSVSSSSRTTSATENGTRTA